MLCKLYLPITFKNTISHFLGFQPDLNHDIYFRRMMEMPCLLPVGASIFFPADLMHKIGLEDWEPLDIGVRKIWFFAEEGAPEMECTNTAIWNGESRRDLASTLWLFYLNGFVVGEDIIGQREAADALMKDYPLIEFIKESMEKSAA